MKCSVIGARGKVGPVPEFVVRLKEVAGDQGLEAQAFDADMVFGEEHLLVAWDHAERAFARGTNIASDRMMEVLLFAAGERQIETALAKMGLKERQDRLVLLILGEARLSRLLTDLGLERSDDLIDAQVDKLAAFGVSEEEVQSVESERVFDLVLERVALGELWRS
ncbi:MAG: KEOPS complex subunit Cgi121 [Thermoplasmata archaeon]